MGQLQYSENTRRQKAPKGWSTFDGRKDKRGKTNCDKVACSGKTDLSTMKNPSSNYV